MFWLRSVLTLINRSKELTIYLQSTIFLMIMSHMYSTPTRFQGKAKERQQNNKTNNKSKLEITWLLHDLFKDMKGERPMLVHITKSLI